MLSVEQRDKIAKAYQGGRLRVRSVSPAGQVEWKRVCHVQRAEVVGESIWEAHTEKGPLVLTGGHRVFTSPTTKIEMEKLQAGQSVLGVEQEQVGTPVILRSRQIKNRAFMYDLTAEDWHNFVLHRSGVVVSNSPDKHYHFRPPEHEGVVGKYNRVFGHVWDDSELIEYLERSLDWWNMFPPSTMGICTMDALLSQYPAWGTVVLWGAIVHAAMALAFNWIQEEFDYSIGGVSLSIERSSKYESMKSNAESQFDKATEAKMMTVKFIRGLQQPKYGIGIRSAFGPHVGRGVLSPRNFI